MIFFFPINNKPRRQRFLNYHESLTTNQFAKKIWIKFTKSKRNYNEFKVANQPKPNQRQLDIRNPKMNYDESIGLQLCDNSTRSHASLRNI